MVIFIHPHYHSLTDGINLKRNKSEPQWDALFFYATKIANNNNCNKKSKQRLPLLPTEQWPNSEERKKSRGSAGITSTSVELGGRRSFDVWNRTIFF